jgi:hypothetical protein
MIKTYQILHKGTTILLGIGLDNAVLDVVTNESQLRGCLELLQEQHRALGYTLMGTFGNYDVTLNVNDDDTVSIFIDGPYFEPTRSQSAAIWLGKEDLQRLLVEALQGVKDGDTARTN